MACTLFFCHSRSHSHNDISNVYLLVVTKATIKQYDCDYDYDTIIGDCTCIGICPAQRTRA
jgi:hypothetical protein